MLRCSIDCFFKNKGWKIFQSKHDDIVDLLAPWRQIKKRDADRFFLFHPVLEYVTTRKSLLISELEKNSTFAKKKFIKYSYLLKISLFVTL